jgi:alkylation response protein AidB-like acyl-CoA dehydrogenase
MLTTEWAFIRRRVVERGGPARPLVHPEAHSHIVRARAFGAHPDSESIGGIVSTNAQQNRYKADLREFKFLLFEQFRLGELLSKAPFENWGVDEVNMVLEGALAFATEVVGPLNASGDREGCRIENGAVKVPAGFKEAWDKLYAAGWKTISAKPEWDGQGAPLSVYVAIEEFLSGANTAFNMYPGLAYGAAEVIEMFATHEQKEKFMRKMYSGAWGGTMCLTEPQAGSDVGSARTTAKRRADGRYDIKGTKIYISGGDHDMAENVIHLVLARVEGAPAGTKGLSLFLVPKRRINDDGSSGELNDVVVGSIEHKMGIRASATCVLNFGENDGCIGELVGTAENHGMTQMFRMMNGARIAVGLQSVAVASSAYLNALEYAKDRKQGSSIKHWKDATAPRVAIIEHPDVRRMLLDMKARVEGIRALVFKLASHEDGVLAFSGKDDAATAYHQGQVDLLVPLVKAYGSDQAFRVCETAIQTYGGAGYIQDYPVEQYARDAKIFSIYEGTNHIQSMDLVGRKLGQNGGANLQAFLGDVQKFVAANEAHPIIGSWVKELAQAAETIGGSAMKLLMWFQTGNLAMVPLAANRFLEMMSEVAVGWLLLDQARIATEALASVPAGDEGARDRAFYEGKKAAAKYFALNVLPSVKLKGELMNRDDTSPMEIPTESFAGV